MSPSEFDEHEQERPAPLVARLRAFPLHSPRGILVIVSLLLLVTLFGLTELRTYTLERKEQEHEGRFITLAKALKQDNATAVSVRLTELTLLRNDEVLFELCSRDALSKDLWQNTLSIAILRLSPPELLLKTPLDAAHLALVRRNDRGACLQLGSGVIEYDGAYSVDVVFGDKKPAGQILDVPLRARVLARHSLSTWDRGIVIAMAGSVLLLLLGLWRDPSRLPASSSHESFPVAMIGICTIGLASQLPLWGSTLGLLKGFILAVIQVGFALTAGSSTVLALHRPRRQLTALTLAIVAGFLLSQNARLWLKIVPSSGTAPVETFISWPSGLLAFAAMGLLLPLAEELFFRGFLYGALLKFGRTTAFLVSLIAFVLLHVQQTWGNWGSLLSIFGTGLVLTSLRALTASTLVPALTHVVYNLLLALSSL